MTHQDLHDRSPHAGIWRRRIAGALCALAFVAGTGTAAIASAQTLDEGQSQMPSSLVQTSSVTAVLPEEVMPSSYLPSASKATAPDSLIPPVVGIVGPDGDAEKRTYELSDGDSIDLGAYQQHYYGITIFSIKHGGTYTFYGMNTQRVQIKVDAPSDEEVYLWLNGVIIDDHVSYDIAPVAVEGSSHVTFRGDPGASASTLEGSTGRAGIEVQSDARAIFGDGAHIIAHGYSGSAGIGGSGGYYTDWGFWHSNGESDSGKLIFEDGCDILAFSHSAGEGAPGYNSGAGIGSGYDGYAHAITIRGGSVSAYGAGEAAALGAGEANSGGNGGTIESITISGGTVYAESKGPGAGIGTGQARHMIHVNSSGDITITGGDVYAYSKGGGVGIGTGNGTDEKGDIRITGGRVHTGDIGTPENGFWGTNSIDCTISIEGGYVSAGYIGRGNSTGNTEIMINGGTVLAEGINGLEDEGEGKVRIWGGSVSANVATATGYHLSNDDHSVPVFRVTLAVPDAPNKQAKVSVQADGITQYFTNGIETDDNGFLYLYLPLQSGKENTADVTVDGVTYHLRDNYTTSADGEGWLKMDGGQIQFKDEGVYLYPDGTATVALDDADGAWDGAIWDFAVTGAATLADGSAVTSPGAAAAVKAVAGAEPGDTYTVTATKKGGSSRCYWTASPVSVTKAICRETTATAKDLSKTFDGVPITPEDVAKTVTTNSGGDVTVALEAWDDEWKPVDSALVAGRYGYDDMLYRAVISVAENGTYAPLTIYQEFHISKAPTTTTATATANIEDGNITGWTINVQVTGFIEGYLPTSLSKAKVTVSDARNSNAKPIGEAAVADDGTATIVIPASAVGDPATCLLKVRFEESSYYYLSSEKTLSRLPAEASVSVSDLTKTYDGVAITESSARSQVVTTSDGNIDVVLEQKNGETWQRVNEAVDAGHYRAAATTQATASYGSKTAVQEFDILPAATTTDVMGTSIVQDGKVAGWTFTARVSGLAEGHAAGAVTFSKVTDAGDAAIETVNVRQDGTASVTVSADGIEGGSYTIKAAYAGGTNYKDSEGTLAATLYMRSIQGETSRKATFGTDKTLDLGMTTDVPLPGDAWHYEVAEDSYAGYTKADGTPAEATVSVSDDGKVTIHHAGTAIIKVTLSDTSAEKAYPDAVSYVTVKVEKAPLLVDAFAYEGDRSTPAVDVVYGGLDGLSSDLKYSYDGGKDWSDDAPDWNEGFVGTLSAGAVDTKASVGTLNIPVVQNAGTFKIDGVAHEGFFSRDYDIAYSDFYALHVAKRPLHVTVDDASGVYGGEAPQLSWSADDEAGLASFDTEARVFDEAPHLAIDASVTGSADFASIAVKHDGNGTVVAYEDALTAEGGISANYEVTFERADLTVEPEDLADASRITVAAEAQNLVYSGKPQTVGAISVSDRDAALEEGRDFATAWPENAVDAGTYEVVLAGQGNYAGTVSVSYTIEQAPLAVSTTSARKVYDGQALVADSAVLEGLVNDETATIAATGTIADAGMKPNTYSIQWGTAKESNYRIDKESLGLLLVTPRTLTIRTDSATKPYDGKPLTAGGALEGLVEGETVSFAVTGTQTEVGSSTNAYTLAWDGSAKLANYDVREDLGTLQVTPIATAVTLTAPSAEKIYDGTPLVATNAIEAEGLPEGVTAEAAVSGSQTGAGTSASHIESYRLLDASGNDVTSIFGNVTLVDGTLAVAPAPLLVMTPSASKMHDGEPLVANEGATLVGLVGNETATLAVTGTQTDVGSSTNTYAIQWGTAQEENYAVSESLGTLTVTKSENEVVVTTTGGTFRYDGAPHGASVTVSGLPEGYTVAATSSATATHAAEGTIKATADSLQIFDASGRDVTKNLNIAYVDGSITILPRPFSVTTGSATKVYDGEPLANTKAYAFGLAKGETAEIVATGAITDAGTVQNGYELRWIGTAMPSDYYVARENLGALTVTPAPLLVTTPSAEKVYDGVALTATEGASLEGLAAADEPRVTLIVLGSQTDAGTSTNTYEINWADVKSENYTITEDLGTLTVKPAEVRVSPENLKKLFGHADPELKAKIAVMLEDGSLHEGLYGNDSISFRLVRTAGERTGSYAVAAVGDEYQGNYHVTYGTATFTIAAADEAPSDNGDGGKTDSGKTDSGKTDSSSTQKDGGTQGASAGQAGSAGSSAAAPATSGAKQAGASVPDTGDTTNLVLPVVLVLGGAAAVALALILRHRKG
ncbi:MAG: MBG domain-containing protein [Atopobiaceae bacterium]